MNHALNTSFLSPKLAQRANLDVRAGDTVRVHVKIEEKGKTRIQMFEGLVLARKHGSQAGGSITVRKISHGVGVERIFPIYSPMIDQIEVIRRARTRRSKLYFIREKVARDIRRKMRSFVDFVASPRQGFSDEELMAAEEIIADEPVIDPSADEAGETPEAEVAETPVEESSTEETPTEEKAAE